MVRQQKWANHCTTLHWTPRTFRNQCSPSPSRSPCVWPRPPTSSRDSRPPFRAIPPGAPWFGGRATTCWLSRNLASCLRFQEPGMEKVNGNFWTDISDVRVEGNSNSIDQNTFFVERGCEIPPSEPRFGGRATISWLSKNMASCLQVQDVEKTACYFRP